MKIIVDADACPKTVLSNCFIIGNKYDISVWTVASFNHVIDSNHHIMVGDDPQATDMKIINCMEQKDIIVTQDFGLAAIVLGKKGVSIHPNGWVYDPDKMEFMLEEREMKARLRRGGGRTKGPKKRSSDLDQLFANTLERIIQDMRR